MSDKVTWQIVLACRHVLIYTMPTPKLGDKLYCRRCQTEQSVIDAPADYRVKCRSCGMGRPKGRDLAAAEQLAARHYAAKTRHVVQIWDGLRLIVEYRDQPQEPLTNMPVDRVGDMIPF